MEETIQDLLVKLDSLVEARRYRDALSLGQRMLSKFKGNRALILKLASLSEICKEYEQALALYRNVHQAIQSEGGSTDLSIVIAIAHLLLRTEQYEQAESFYQQLRDKAGNNADVLAGLASCRRQKGLIDEAQQLADKALSIDGANRLALYEMAQILIDKQQSEEAIVLLEKNLERNDIHGDSIDLWLSTLQGLNRDRYAQDKLELYAKQFPQLVEFVYGFAVLANKAGEVSLARPAYQKALEISPNNPRILYELAVLERISGNLDVSNQLLEKTLTINPDNPAALRTYGAEIKYAYGDNNYKRLNYVAAKFSEFSALEQLHLHYAMAKVCEDVDEMDTAFRHYQVGGDKKRVLEEYNDAEAGRLQTLIPQVVTKANLDMAGDIGSDSEVPVFILGMPRSGTSLMEQILSSHPDIYGAGELKFLSGIMENIGLGENKGIRVRMGEKEPVFDYDDNASWALRGEKFVEKLEKLADKPYKRIVDKMPGNCNFVGLIHAILPKAKIIHSRRHPVETCLSCYRIHFAEGHQWSYNLRELGRHYRRYWNLMQYWRDEFPGVMYEARYEDNVADVEQSAKNLISHLGLEWDANCLNFYNTDRPVKTASVTQVRKPIYKTSTNRWRRYEKYLGPLLEEIGDIVEDYESQIAHLLEK